MAIAFGITSRNIIVWLQSCVIAFVLLVDDEFGAQSPSEANLENPKVAPEKSALC